MDFTKRKALVLLAVAVLVLLWGSQFISCSKSSGEALEPPEAIFLIVVDTLRADRLSCYGYQAHETPNIDRIAEMGMTFKHAYSSASWTVPSMGAILTSCHPSQLGLLEEKASPKSVFKWRQRRNQYSLALPTFKRSMAEFAAEAGYHTAAFVNQPGLNAGNGFDRGFLDYYYPLKSGEIWRKVQGETNDKQNWGSVEDAFHNDRKLIRIFEQWIDGHSENKMFVWLHLVTPHRPYNPLPRFINLRTGHHRETKSTVPISHRYDAEILATDEIVGEALAAIEEHVGLKRSLIIFASDHGEEFFEHGKAEHGHSLHREVVHVPLIFAYPPFESGSTIDSRVGTIDILPTLLDIIGSQAQEKLKGNSLLPVMMGEIEPSPENMSENELYCEGMLYGPTRRCYLEDNYKMIYNKQDDSFLLFDIREDPNETENLADKKPELVEAMWRKMVRTFSRNIKEYRRLLNKFSADKMNKSVRKEQLKALETLGYVSR
jgi:arylsulfatase A-like enzyme